MRKLPYSLERMFKHDLDNRLIWSWEKMAMVYIKELPCSSLLSLFGTITRGEFNNARARRALVVWYLSLFVMCKA